MRHHDESDGPVAGFVDQLAAWRDAPAPPPGAALRQLFAQVPVVAPPAAVTPRRTPVSDSKRLLAAVPAKIAAGVLGALLAGSLGAGAMTGTIALTSQESDAPETTEVLADDQALVEDEVDQADDVAEDDAVAGADVEEAEEVDEAEETDDAEGTEEEPKKDAGDPMTAPIPTSVSEAAKNHQFDEACGNHGAYVSHFARTGEEPECATTARAGGTPAATEVEAAESTETADEPKAERSNNASAKGAEKSEAGKAKAAANNAKAGGTSKGGR